MWQKPVSRDRPVLQKYRFPCQHKGMAKAQRDTKLEGFLHAECKQTRTRTEYIFFLICISSLSGIGSSSSLMLHALIFKRTETVRQKGGPTLPTPCQAVGLCRGDGKAQLELEGERGRGRAGGGALPPAEMEMRAAAWKCNR